MKRRESQEILIMLGLNLAFVGLIALLLWPMGKAAMALSLAKGFAVLWIAVWGSTLILSIIERALRIDPDERYTVYVGMNLLVSAFLVACWSAFAALTVGSSAAGSALWLAAVQYVIGFLSSYLTFAVVTSFYSGSVYKVVTLPLALVSYLVFAAWPAAGRAAFGWLFSLLG